MIEVPKARAREYLDVASNPHPMSQPITVVKRTPPKAKKYSIVHDTEKIHGVEKRHLFFGGIAVAVLIFIIALAAGLSGSDGDDAVPTDPQSMADALRAAYDAKETQCNMLTDPPAIIQCNNELRTIFDMYRTADALANPPPPSEDRSGVVIIISPAINCSLVTVPKSVNSGGACLDDDVPGRFRRNVDVEDLAGVLRGMNATFIRNLVQDIVVNRSGIPVDHIDQILLSGTAVKDAVQVKIVLADFVSKRKSELAAFELNTAAANGTLTNLVNEAGPIFNVLQVLGETVKLPINATRIQELAMQAAQNEAVQTVAAAAAEVYGFDTFGVLATEVLPHLDFILPPNFNTSVGSSNMGASVSFVQGPNISVLELNASASLNGNCGPVDALCELVRQSLGSSNAAGQLALRMQGGPGNYVDLDVSVALQNIRLKSHDSCPTATPAANAILTEAEVYADVHGDLQGPLVVLGLTAEVGVRFTVDIELGRRPLSNPNCMEPIIQPLRLYGSLAVGSLSNPIPGISYTGITMLTGVVHSLGVIYQPFGVPSVALSNIMVEVDFIPYVMSFSRFEGAATISLGQQCFLRNSETLEISAVVPASSTNGCIRANTIFGVGLGLGDSLTSGSYFVATIADGLNIGQLVNAFAPERVTSVVNGWPLLVTESGFVGPVQVTFATSDMTLGTFGNNARLPMGLSVTGSLVILGFRSDVYVLVDPGKQLRIESNFSLGPNWGDWLSYDGGQLLVDISGPGQFRPPTSVAVLITGNLRILYTRVYAEMQISDTTMTASVQANNVFGVAGLSAAVQLRASTPQTSWTLDGLEDALMSADVILSGQLVFPAIPLAGLLDAYRQISGPLVSASSWVVDQLNDFWDNGEDAINSARNAIQSLGLNIPDTGLRSELDDVRDRINSLQSQFETAMLSVDTAITNIQLSGSFEAGTGGSVGSYLTATITAVLSNGQIRSFTGRIQRDMSAQEFGIMVFNAVVENIAPVAAQLRTRILDARGRFDSLRSRLEAADRGYVYTRQCNLLQFVTANCNRRGFLDICIGYDDCPNGYSSLIPPSCVMDPYRPCENAAPGYNCFANICVLSL